MSRRAASATLGRIEQVPGRGSPRDVVHPRSARGRAPGGRWPAAAARRRLRPRRALARPPAAAGAPVPRRGRGPGGTPAAAPPAPEPVRAARPLPGRLRRRPRARPEQPAAALARAAGAGRTGRGLARPPRLRRRPRRLCRGPRRARAGGLAADRGRPRRGDRLHLGQHRPSAPAPQDLGRIRRRQCSAMRRRSRRRWAPRACAAIPRWWPRCRRSTCTAWSCRCCCR